MMVSGILWPTFLLVALIFAVWITMFAQRGALMRRSPPRPEDFASGEAALRYFQPVEMAANNLRNLFEMPVLYFALVALLIVTRNANHIQEILAWAFVILRIWHSFEHIVTKQVPRRFLAYLLSCVVLMAMWIGFAVDIAAVN